MLQQLKEEARKEFRFMGDGYILSYSVAIDNSFREEFFETEEEAKKKAEELKNTEYIGLSSIKKAYEYWIF